MDSGNFNWSAHAEKFPGLCQPDDSYHGLTYTQSFGKMAYITKIVSQLMRDLGSVPAPMNSFLLNVGLQTLHLRMQRHCDNAQRIAEFLRTTPRGMDRLSRTARRQVPRAGPRSIFPMAPAA